MNVNQIHVPGYFWNDNFKIQCRSKFVFSLLLNNKQIWRQNSNNGTNLPPLSRAIWRILLTHVIAEEKWLLQWIWISSDACGQANSIWIRYLWTGKFWIRKEKVADSNIFRYVWTGSKLRFTVELQNCKQYWVQILSYKLYTSKSKSKLYIKKSLLN